MLRTSLRMTRGPRSPLSAHCALCSPLTVLWILSAFGLQDDTWSPLAAHSAHCPQLNAYRSPLYGSYRPLASRMTRGPRSPRTPLTLPTAHCSPLYGSYRPLASRMTRGPRSPLAAHSAHGPMLTPLSSFVFRLCTFASLKSQMLGSETVPQVVPLRSLYAFVVYFTSIPSSRISEMA